MQPFCSFSFFVFVFIIIFFINSLTGDVKRNLFQNISFNNSFESEHGLTDPLTMVERIHIEWIRRFFGLRGFFPPGALISHSNSGLGGFLGSGPGRERSPVEWGEISFIRLFVRSSPRVLRGLERPGEPSERPGKPFERSGEPSERPVEPFERP